MIVIALIIIAAYFIINAFHISTPANSEALAILKGTFIYNNNVKYEFDGNGKGAMYDGNTKYDYTYTIQEGNLMMDFKNEAVHDATYTYQLEGEVLTLIGGEGTTGGEYTLNKERD